MPTITQSQIEKLLPFTTSQKFGKLIEDAIETWTNNAGFIFGRFGISKKTNVFTLESGECCCLIGAALLNKTRLEHEDYSHSAERIYGNDVEYSEIWRGFDCNEHFDERWKKAENYEDFIFGYNIRQILLGREIVK